MSTVGTLYDEAIKFGYAKLLTVNIANNSSALDFVSGLALGYDSYIFDVDKLYSNVSNANLYWRVSSDSGSSYIQTTYLAGISRVLPTVGHQFVGYNAGTEFVPQLGPGASQSLSGRVYMQPAQNKFTWHFSAFVDGYRQTLTFGGGANFSVATINAVRFAFASANLTTGAIRLYGMKKGT
jgi:hypothetical protein